MLWAIVTPVYVKFLIKHAPVKKKSVRVKHSTPWFNNDIHVAKHQRHKLERQWHHTKLTVHYDIFKSLCVVMKNLTKRDYLSSKV